MRFNKYWVALKLSSHGIGRQNVLNEIFNKRFFNSKLEIEEYKSYLTSQNIEVLSSNEDIYPVSLKQISDYPLILFIKGKKELLLKPMVTVVGTRKMSSYGKWVVKYILKHLKSLDIVVVSGLANGIDEEVHKTCLEFGIPTIAIVAGGIDKGYPKSNQSIYNDISKKGLIISEFPPGREIIKGMFPMRNRILAGISLVTVVIESDIKGGSLITLNLALEYGREIFCVPCNINRYSLQGCNMCISQGATPLYSPNQLLKFLQKRVI
jgi:DNA processing protein